MSESIENTDMNDNKAPNRDTVELAILTSEERLKGVVQSHTTLIKVSVIFAFIALLTVASLFIVITVNRSHNTYFAVSSDGKMMALKPLSEPIMSTQAVAGFVDRTIANTFTFDYVHYKTQITHNAESYTSYAFNAIKKELEGAHGLVKEALQQHWVVSTQVLSDPEVVHVGKIGKQGPYGWEFLYPKIMVTFQNEQVMRSSVYSARVIVIRVNQMNKPRGIVIKMLQLTRQYQRA